MQTILVSKGICMWASLGMAKSQGICVVANCFSEFGGLKAGNSLANAWAVTIIAAVFSVGIYMLTPSKIWLLFFIASLNLVATPCFATVYYSKEEAMKLAFSDDAQVEVLSLFPTQDEVAEIERLSKVKLDSNLVSLFVGKKQGVITGYAMIESHTVRTQPETLLLVLTPEGQLSNIYTLAFHEPPEYQPPQRWFAQLINRKLDELSFDKEVQAVAGATLSTRASLNSARKVLAIYQVMLKQPKN